MPSNFLREIMASNPDMTRAREVNMDFAKPYVLSGPEPEMKHRQVKEVADLAWKKDFACRLEEGLVIRIYGGEVYLMVTYNDDDGVHRFHQANGMGYVFHDDDYLEFLAFLNGLTAKPKPAYPGPAIARFGAVANG